MNRRILYLAIFTGVLSVFFLSIRIYRDNNTEYLHRKCKNCIENGKTDRGVLYHGKD